MKEDEHEVVGVAVAPGALAETTNPAVVALDGGIGEPVLGAGGDAVDVAPEHVNPMWVPSGRYRLAIDITAVPLSDRAAPVAEVEVHQERRGEIARFSIAAGATPSFEFEIDNHGGATSSDAIAIYLSPGEAASLELSGATLTRLDPRGISPFQLFRRARRAPGRCGTNAR